MCSKASASRKFFYPHYRQALRFVLPFHYEAISFAATATTTQSQVCQKLHLVYKASARLRLYYSFYHSCLSQRFT
jgi:hypothetical protein